MLAVDQQDPASPTYTQLPAPPPATGTAYSTLVIDELALAC